MQDAATKARNREVVAPVKVRPAAEPAHGRGGHSKMPGAERQGRGSQSKERAALNPIETVVLQRPVKDDLSIRDSGTRAAIRLSHYLPELRLFC